MLGTLLKAEWVVEGPREGEPILQRCKKIYRVYHRGQFRRQFNAHSILFNQSSSFPPPPCFHVILLFTFLQLAPLRYIILCSPRRSLFSHFLHRPSLCERISPSLILLQSLVRNHKVREIFSVPFLIFQIIISINSIIISINFLTIIFNDNFN